MIAPTLQTSRLTLRGYAMADFDAFAEMMADAGVQRFISGKAMTREEAWRRFMQIPGHWELKGFGTWAVEEAASGRYVGDMGFANYERIFSPLTEPILDAAGQAVAPLDQPDYGDAPEMGWALASWAHRKGYALEAGEAALSWARDHFGPERTAALISPENAPSLRLAEKLGFARSGACLYKTFPTLVYERTL